jgi:sugar/nucleoside kinase (ribokinase family)
VTVLVVGDVVTDILAIHPEELVPGSDTPARVHLTGGGSAANTACWLASLGRPVALVGVVGDDRAGTDRLAELTDAGVGVAVRSHPGARTGSVVVLSHGTDRTMLCDRGANTALSTVDVDAALDAYPDARHLHLSGYALFDGGSRDAARYALGEAARRGLTTSVDAASTGPLSRVGADPFLTWVHRSDLLLANLAEARTLTSHDGPPVELAQALAEHAPHVVVKLAEQGAVWTVKYAEPVVVPAEPATVVDPTGAGDAFAAGLLDAWLSGADPVGSLRAGTRLGAAAVAVTGGRPPRRLERATRPGR